MSDLLSIALEYERTLLTESFRSRIREREMQRLFPFSVHNIYRVLLAISETWYEGFSLLNTALDLHQDDTQALLGLPSRVFRYFHVVLLGAYLVGPTLPDHILGCLRSLAGPIAFRIASQLIVPQDCQAEGNAYLSKPLPSRREVITLAIFLREYVDFLFLGQHDRAFSSYPPLQELQGTLVLRSFHHLADIGLPWNEIQIYTCYDPDVLAELHYDRFRGDIERLPPPNRLRSAVAILPDERRQITSGDISRLLQTMECNLKDFQRSLLLKTPLEVECMLAQMFSTELLALLASAGQDTSYWQARITNAVAEVHSASPEQDSRLSSGCCFTDIYLARLREALSAIRGREQEIKHHA